MRGRAAAPSPPPRRPPGTRLCQTLVDSRESQAGPPALPVPPRHRGLARTRGGLGEGWEGEPAAPAPPRLRQPLVGLVQSPARLAW